MRLRLFGITAALVLAGGLAPAAGSPNGLMALYSFNGTLRDSSGNAKTAATGGAAASYVAGAPFGGKALKFGGAVKSIVTVPLNISVAALPQVTFGAWVHASTVQTPQYGLVSNDDGDFDRTLDIDNRTGGSAPTWSAFIGGSVVGKVPAVPGKWMFVAVSYDQQSAPGTYTFYVNDGSKTSVLTGADSFDSDSVTKGVTIGSNPNFDQAFRGEISNLFFYRGILTKDRIEAIAAKGPSAIPGSKGN
jgi:hypothetical protein